MRDNLTVYLNKKKTIFFTFLGISSSIIFILLMLLAMYFITNLYYIPSIQQNKSDSWAILTVLIFCFLPVLIFFKFIVMTVSAAIKSVKKEEIIIINHRGILYNESHNFAKPIFIHWNYIEDMRIIESANVGLPTQKFFSKFSNDNKIVFKLKEEFYNDFSPIKKIMYKLNSKILKGFAFEISLKFTDGDINEIFDKILTKHSAYIKTHNKQINRFDKIKDKFVGYFNTKKVVLSNLLSLFVNIIITFVCIYVFTLPSSEILRVRLPIIGHTENLFIIKCFLVIVTIPIEIYSISLFLLLIKLTLINKEKKFLVIDKDGILWYKPNIFSKPMLIEWNHIENICVFNPKKYLFTNNYKHAIAIKITQEFYNNASFFAKIIYSLNRKFSTGYELNINLNFSKCDADEILNEINKYDFK